jgi:hypothetical protein
MTFLGKKVARKPSPRKRPTRADDGSKLPTFYGPHHGAIGAILRGQRPHQDLRADLAWDAQVRGFAHCLALDNRLFDSERFFRECGGLPTQQEKAA